MNFDYLVLAISLITLGAYTWSVRGHFASEGMPKGAGIIAAFVAVNAIMACVLILFWSQPSLPQIVGVLMQLAAGVVFVAAILASREAKLKFVFDPIHPHGLVKTGPYKYVRHPFYVSYILFWTGWAIAIWSLVVIPSVVIFWVLYYRAARVEERNFAGTSMAQEYADYSKTTGFFWPKFNS